MPLCFQFSGTIFYSAPDGTLQIDQIGWDKEARFRLPARVWREMMDHYYPEQRLAALAPRCLRAPVRVQAAAMAWRPGKKPSKALLAPREGGCFMNFEPLEKIANAVLYEGFLLYPYRKSSVKNQQRWHFGTLGPVAGPIAR